MPAASHILEPRPTNNLEDEDEYDDDEYENDAHVIHPKQTALSIFIGGE